MCLMSVLIYTNSGFGQLHPGGFNSSEGDFVFLYVGCCNCGCDFKRGDTA